MLRGGAGAELRPKGAARRERSGSEARSLAGAGVLCLACCAWRAVPCRLHGLLGARTRAPASGRPHLTPAARTEAGRRELLFLSHANPGQLERLCAHL